MERKVLKRRIKGLAAFVLAVVMMFGSSISAWAESYIYEVVKDDSEEYIALSCTLEVGKIITSEDDISNPTKHFYALCCKIDDGDMDEVGYGSSGNTIYFSNFLEEGKSYEVTAVEPNGEYLEITVKTIVDSGESGSGSTGGEEGGSTGESTEDTGSFESTEDIKVEDKDTKKKDEEKKPEEPKESEEQIFNRELLESAAVAKAGDNVTIDATLWHSFSSDVLKELLSKGGVSYTLYYNYEGECFYITLPAGAVLEEGCEWYGPLKLNAMFGRTMIDKKDLHAAIDG